MVTSNQYDAYGTIVLRIGPDDTIFEDTFAGAVIIDNPALPDIVSLVTKNSPMKISSAADAVDDEGNLILYLEQNGYYRNASDIGPPALLSTDTQFVKTATYNETTNQYETITPSPPTPTPLPSVFPDCGTAAIWTGSWRGPVQAISRYGVDNRKLEYNVVTLTTNEKGWVNAGIRIFIPGNETEGGMDVNVPLFGAINQDCRVTLVGEGSSTWYIFMPKGSEGKRKLRVKQIEFGYDSLSTNNTAVEPPSLVKLAEFQKVSGIPGKVYDGAMVSENNDSSRHLHCKGNGLWKGCVLPQCNASNFAGTWVGNEVMA